MKLLAMGALVAAGCFARVNEGDDTAADASDNGGQDGSADAAPPDAVPPDALPCTGGQAQATDPSTGSCYELFTPPLEWQVARAACQARGGDLAVVTSPDENAILADLIGDNLDAYLGATDLAMEMTWTWVDATAFAYDNWRDGEPNNAGDDFQEDCAIIEGDQGGTWDDRPCAEDPLAGPAQEYAYICER